MLRIIVIATAVLMGIGCCACGSKSETESGGSQVQSDFSLEGKGSMEEPYLIKSVGDAEWLSLQVNEGTEFEGVYFQQEVDLDFSEYGNWTPIGAFGTGFSFRGVYDGKGHSIQNITIDGNELAPINTTDSDKLGYQNVGFFGVLGGVVANLKIESGTITGNCIGSIASHGTGNAVIANCYNEASLTATGRCGGIVDNFGSGKIICCANAGKLKDEVKENIGGITSYSARTVYGCFSIEEPLSNVFSGQIYNTEKVKEVYPGIQDEYLDRAQQLFKDDLKGVKLVSLKKTERKDGSTSGATNEPASGTTNEATSGTTK